MRGAVERVRTISWQVPAGMTTRRSVYALFQVFMDRKEGRRNMLEQDPEICSVEVVACHSNLR